MREVVEWITVGAYQVDSRLLESRSLERCRLEECKASCCTLGVAVDVAEAGRLRERAAVLRPFLPAASQDEERWFEKEAVEDGDFPTHYCVRTSLVEDPSRPGGTKCVFLRDDNLCALHRAAVDLGRPVGDFKPLYCRSHPLTLVGDKLHLNYNRELESLGGSCVRCSARRVPLHEIFEAEITAAIGRQGYEQLRASDRRAD